jgi:hypothetical protein
MNDLGDCRRYWPDDGAVDDAHRVTRCRIASSYQAKRLMPSSRLHSQVSYFVRESTALDAEAQRRATTVYLVDRTVPMLPPLLCEQLCRYVWGGCSMKGRDSWEFWTWS